MKKKAKEKHDITLEWDLKALEFLANGYDINYGARSIKHEVERRVVNQIAAAHEYGLIDRGSHLLISANLPTDQQEDVNIVKGTSTKKKDVQKSRSDIILRKQTRVDNNSVKYVDIELAINSFGKYSINSE